MNGYWITLNGGERVELGTMSPGEYKARLMALAVSHGWSSLTEREHRILAAIG